MQQKLLTIETEALSAIDEAGSLKELNDLKVRYLGKKGVVTELLRGMDSISASERPLVGQMINEIKKNLSERFAATETDLEKAVVARRLQDEKIDISIPGFAFPRGTRHPLSIIVEEIEDIFIGMGYCIEEGPEVELDLYNFELLNMPKNHPARDMQDSFYFSDNVLLRTHTSPMQARTMKSLAPKLPVKIICPGTVYRRDDDATHSPMFHQVEGLFVGECVSLADLKGTLLYFARQMFGADREIRLRPSYFPFTEPSAEVDISCFICGGGGCRLCKNTGWIEILGSGMVHPNVLSMCGYNPKEVSGFAFGMGVERIAMLKYGISDMRLFFDNDIRFLEQF